MRRIPFIFLSSLALSCVTSSWAAKPIDLSQQPTALMGGSFYNNLQQVSSSTDFNQTTHLRLRQMYSGHPVWGADAIAHIPHGGKTGLMSLTENKNTTMNGIIYQALDADLNNTPAYVFNQAQADQAFKQAVALYQQKAGFKQEVSQQETKLIVYVDHDNKAHWAFLVSFFIHPTKNSPAKPVYILDAMSFKVYKQWNNLQTLENTIGGGFGGNDNVGKIVYDGLKGDYPVLKMDRDAGASVCYLENTDVKVEDVRQEDTVSQFKCGAIDKKHNNVYWDGDENSINGAYSPDNDALFAGNIIKSMYQKWYNLPVLTKNDKPMQLVMRVHEEMENAYWDGETMTFGDGGSMFYPLVSLGVSAHEISHGFTEQHSHLIYDGESGGLNESFSDMAAQAAEFYAFKHNSWQIGPEIMKQKGTALRYMDEPTKDCEGKKPGDECSISHVKDYNESLDVHFSSGVFNKAFYLMSTTKGWTTKKAFDVMIQANQHYWTENTTFAMAACGVIKATQDYKYDTKAVKNVMKKVGIDISKC